MTSIYTSGITAHLARALLIRPPPSTRRAGWFRVTPALCEWSAEFRCEPTVVSNLHPLLHTVHTWQAACTPKELKEVLSLPGVSVSAPAGQMELSRADATVVAAQRKARRLVELVSSAAAQVRGFLGKRGKGEGGQGWWS
eukprot:361678-Chlamydomonas_euryale.AAC.1